MASLPVIVGFGGINAAGRSSSHHAYRRMVFESLDDDLRQETFAGLAVMMGLVQCDDGKYVSQEGKVLSFADIDTEFGEEIINGTLIRKIEPSYFDVDNAMDYAEVEVGSDKATQFELPKRKLPVSIPESWSIAEIDEKRVRVTVNDILSLKVKTSRAMAVQSAGQIPRGFDPATLYNSRYHPRGLQFTVVAAADAVNSIGVPWEKVVNAIAPDEMAVYASSSISQLDENGFGGMLQARLNAKRLSSKQVALGMNNMPADFVNAYICGGIGGTGSMTGACASFLYNLRLGVKEIIDGTRRVVIIGCSEAPITQEIIEGFDAMGALARVEQLEKLDKAEKADLRRSSRPFGENCGFTIAESAQYVVLMDDALAIELGADIHGAISDVFVNADGYKKSISSPGAGNYVTLAKAVSSARALLGDNAVKQHSFVQAHGSSTPQNRVTESTILDRIAGVFGISNWPISAVKSYIGHPLGSASGDQLVATLGVFKYGYLPGIKTIDDVADDVLVDKLSISSQDQKLNQPQVAFLNSKGFGGNNATAIVISPTTALSMLGKRYSVKQLQEYERKRVKAREHAKEYDTAFLQGNYQTIYSFGENLIDEKAIVIDESKVTIPGFDKNVDLNMPNPFKDISL